MQFKTTAFGILALLAHCHTSLAAPSPLEARQCIVFDGEVCCSSGDETDCYPDKRLKRSSDLEVRQCIVWDGEICCAEGNDTDCYPEKSKRTLQKRQCTVFDGEVCCSSGDETDCYKKM
jgi:hypothetical protein